MKIVCIGLSKTGITSMKKALQILGYNSVGWSERAAQLYSQKKIYELKKEYIEKFDAFYSEPWSQLYKIFDAFYDCKFICTHRNIDDWYDSIKNHVVSRKSQNNLKLVYPFSDPIKENREMVDYYMEWYNEIFRYFDGRKNIIHISDLRWFEICLLLDKKIPDVPFPHINSVIEHNPKYKTGGN